MLGSSDPTPYDLPAALILVVCSVVLLVGFFFGASWPSVISAGIRRGILLLALLLLIGLHLVTPTRSGIVGAGRLLTLWPAGLLVFLLFSAWCIRAGRL